MGDEPERVAFFEKYFPFQDGNGGALAQMPTISKSPVDLYRLYVVVKERGGFLEVTRLKAWKDCAQVCNLANSSSAAYTLRKQYSKLLLPFECKFDRGGIDPKPLVDQVEAQTAANRKKPKAKPKEKQAQTQTQPQAQSQKSLPSTQPQRAAPAGQQPPPAGAQPQHPHGYPGYPPPASAQAGDANAYAIAHATYGAPPPTGAHSGYHAGYPGPPPGHLPPPPPYPQHGTAMPPPPAPSQPQHQPAPAPSQAPSQPPRHESISIKDPFADDESSSSTGSAATSGRAPPPPPHYPNSVPSKIEIFLSNEFY